MPPSSTCLVLALLIALRDRLQTIDTAIAESRAQIEQNPFNAQLRRQLLYIIEEKRRTLQQIQDHDETTLNAALILSVVFAPTMAQAAWRDEVVRTEKCTMSVPFGGSVRIDHRTGHVKVRGHQRDDLLVEATFRVSANTKANAEAFLRAMQLDVTTAGTTVIVRVNTPQSNSGNNLVGFAVDLDVSVPERIRLTIENRFGDTTVTRVKTPLTISGSNGKILVSDIEAPATLRSRFGGIDAQSGDRRPQDPEQQRRHRGARRPGRRHDDRRPSAA